jgi:CheY-like chemotaxis protein
VDQPLAGQRVLVVDDNDDGRWLVGTILLCHGASVDLAGSVREAIHLYRSARPDVIVSDIGMPEQDGMDLIRTLRAEGDERVRSTPAIAVTGYTSDEDRALALEAGFDVFLARPFDPTELVRAVVDLLGHGRGERRSPE